jgi:anthranilate/para-aminobenzoate synthase component I
MKTIFEFKGSDLPLQARGTREKTLELTELWEEWSAEGPAVLLESAGPLDDAAQWLILAGLPEKEFYEDEGRFWWKDKSGTSPAPFNFWDFADQVGQVQSDFLPLPFCLSSAWFGVLSYEFGQRFNQKKHPRFHNPIPLGSLKETLTDANKNDVFSKNLNFEKRFKVPDFYFFKPSRLIAVHRKSRECFLFGEKAFSPSANTTPSRRSFKIQGLRAQSDPSHYHSIVRRAQEYIRQGDIYQTNLAQSFKARWEGNAATLYRILREINPGPFMGLFQGGGVTLVSSSPERLAAGRGDWLETRPIAGTRPRGKGELEDLQMKVELKTNAKEQAEHLMLVDLARNDLGRVSRYGTVEVNRYADVESYSKVHHLVSSIQSQRRPSARISEILQSLFPGGTITGCPKIRCMEIIQELEGRPRGFYTGSMGYIAPGPCFDFNILIRSFTLFSSGWLEFQAGAGIVADSDPDREFMETLYKVEALAGALGTSLVTHP